MPSSAAVWHFHDITAPNPKASWSKQTVSYTYPNGVTLDDVQQCNLYFDIPAVMEAPVLFYYRLTNFYQNHRRYVKSFQADQLRGEAVSNGTIDTSPCDPLRLDDRGRAYYPCGLIANSMFNDTFSSPILLNPSGSSDAEQEYTMTNNSGIAWDSDKALYGPTKYKYDQIAVPPNWVKRFGGDSYSEEHPPPDLENDQAFQVWMRTAGLPTFSKLAMRNDEKNMETGSYRVDVNDHFPVTVYGGTKSVILSTRTVIGGRNNYLGIAFLVVGGLCIILGGIFTVTHLIKPRYVLNSDGNLTMREAETNSVIESLVTTPTSAGTTSRAPLPQPVVTAVAKLSILPGSELTSLRVMRLSGLKVVCFY